MFLKRCGPSKSHNQHIYWELVESYRTERGPRQRVVAYLGDINETACQDIKQEAEEKKGIGKAVFLMPKVSRTGLR